MHPHATHPAPTAGVRPKERRRFWRGWFYPVLVGALLFLAVLAALQGRTGGTGGWEHPQGLRQAFLEQHADLVTFLTSKIETYLPGSAREARLYAEGIVFSSAKYGVDPILVLALMEEESRFRAHAVSAKSYKGLMQTPDTTRYPQVDIDWGVRILAEKLQRTGGDIPAAVSAYQGGSRIQNWVVYKRYLRYREEYRNRIRTPFLRKHAAGLLARLSSGQ